MTPDTPGGGNEMVGREAELSRLNSFLDDVAGGRAALLLEGESGIGKTTLWKRGVATAAERRWRVLSTRPAEPEAKLSYTGLADLLEGSDDVIQALPSPQRSALEVALLKVGPEEEGSSDVRAVSAGVLTALRTAATVGPVLIAVDDVQWLDPSTASALGFAVRRLENESVGLLLATREPGATPPFGLSRAFPEERFVRVRLEPLSVDDLGALLHARLGASFPRPTLKRLHEMSGGNPFFAIEITRAELRGERRPTGAALPVPRTLREDLLRDRMQALPSSIRETLLYASACSRPTVGVLEVVVGSGKSTEHLTKAADAGIMEDDGGEIRFTHPLYRSAIYAEATREHRHRVHRRLAQVVEDPEERARHLALAAEGPDSEAAAALEEAARAALTRGSPISAAELCELAMRLTPTDRVSDARRLQMAAADYLLLAGDAQRALRLLEPLVVDAPPGPERAEALFHLGRLRFDVMDDNRGASEALADALLEDLVPPNLLSRIHAYDAWAVFFLGDLREAERHAEEAVRLAELGDDPTTLADAFSTLIGMRGALGKKIPRSLMERALELEEVIEPLFVGDHPSVVHSGQLVWAGDLDQARTILVRLLDEAITKGDEESIGGLHWRLGGLEHLAGNWRASQAHRAESMLRTPHPDDLAWMALVEACLGDSRAAKTDAQEALNRRTEEPGLEILARSALGLAELSLGHSASANEHLERAWWLHRSWGIGEPAMFPFVADHAEALIELGRYSEAGEVVDWLEERGRALDRPWALAVAARYRGLLEAAVGDFDAAFASLDQALKEHERLPMPFELGRTLLVLGTIRRRAKQKRPAREALDQALEIFERLGAPLWAEKARAELARIGGRRAVVGQLTEAERRVATLAAAGRTNREIADTLFMSVRTVEGHLSHVYGKLGIRSRTELALFIEEADSSSHS